MSQYFTVHPTHPQPRLINQATGIVRAGGVIAYPTDSCYAIGCQIGNKEAMQRLREDRVTERDERAAFQETAPAVEDGLYLVPKVIE